MLSDDEGEPFLPGLEPPGTIDNLFFACRLAPEAASRVAHVRDELRHAHGLRGAAISPQRLHVSLLGVCECHGLPDDLVAAACEAAASIVMPPFEVVFDRAMSFSNRRKTRPLVLLTGGGEAALAGLRNRLCEAMRAAGFGNRASSHFVPHMTLLYDRRMIAEQATAPVYLTVRDFALVHSLVRRSRHIELARWPLRR
ncbi:MAG: 2'-5' RNA ligase family protein [Rhizobiales bacterium]|nr:2'-5' RNA ligase family protein [Hyphomicrobiales bacterium]